MTISLPFKKRAVKRVASLRARSASLNTFYKEGCNFATWKLWLVLPLGRVEWQPIWGDIKETAAADVSLIDCHRFFLLRRWRCSRGFLLQMLK